MTLLDLLDRRGIEYKRVASLHGGEYHSPCPACGGKDRFHSWPARVSTNATGAVGVWGCRGCNDSGDIISYLIRYEGMSFKDACASLNISATQNEYAPVKLRQKQRNAEFTPTTADLPPTLWQGKNTALVAHAHESLLLRAPAELAWLAARGIDAEAVARYRLGWLPGERGESWYTRPLKAWGLPEDDGKRVFRFPRGLVIPRVDAAGTVIALRIRRTDDDRKGFLPETKYMAFRGAKARPLLILPEGVPLEHVTIVVVEAELDAILIAEAARRAGLPVGALAVLSNNGKPDDAAHHACAAAARVLVAMDFDAAGEKGLGFWLTTYPRARDWPVPAGKDPGDAYKLGVDIALWLGAGLPEAFRPRPVAPAGGPCGGVVCAMPEDGSEHAQAAALLDTGEGAQVAPSAGAADANTGDTVPQEVLRVHGLMCRYDFLFLEVTPESFGVRVPVRWRQSHWDEFKMINEACQSSAVLRWVDAHPVQDGVIDKHNLLARGCNYAR